MISDILAGVLQGDTLAPYQFIIVIDYIMTVVIDNNETDPGFTLRPAQLQSRRIEIQKLENVEFADEVAMVTDCIEEAQHLLKRLEAAASSMGDGTDHESNDSKMELMTV